MSLNFTLSSILPCSAYHWLLPYFSFLYFFFPAWLQLSHSTRCLTLSFCLSVPLSLLQTPVFEYFVRLPLHSQMDALSAPAVQICLSV